MTRYKIAIVAGRMEPARFVAGFDALGNDFDIEYFFIEDPQLLNNFRPTSKLWLFDEVREMQGYMRGLENLVQNCDAMIGVETSRLASFQMVRLARKFHIPSAILVSEQSPMFYVNFPNIRAIQTDIFEHADLFLPVSRAAEGMLRMEGVPAHKTRRMNSFIDLGKFQHASTLRSKFRKYIGIGDDKIVFLYKGALTANAHLDQLLAALRVLQVTHPLLSEKMLFILAGDGPHAKELKYLCHDYQLTKKVLFLHQDLESFTGDLYNAADIRLILDKADADSILTFPLDVLEASATGLICMMLPGHPAAEFLSGNALPLESSQMQHLLKALNAMTPQDFSNDVLREQRAKTFAEKFSSKIWIDQARIILNDLISGTSYPARIPKRKNQTEHFEERLNRGDNRQKMIRDIDEILLDQQGSNDEQTQLWRIKGDALKDIDLLEEAIAAYHKALQLDSNNYRAYCALGFISLSGQSFEEALVFFKKALAKHENYATAMYGIAMVHRRMGFYVEAIYWTERCVDVEGLTQRNTTFLIQTCLECPQVALAEEILERMLEQKTESAHIKRALSQVLMRQGKTERAAILLAEAEALKVG